MLFKNVSKGILSGYLLLFFLVINSTAFAVDPWLDWKTIESDNFYIHYATGYERLAQKTANSAEQAHIKLHSLFNWQPEEKTHLVISDETDVANGFATPLFFNRSVLFMAPPDRANTLEDFDDWLETLITHEYAHILHLDKSTGGADTLRSIFGRHFLLFPNAMQPNWFIEGLATYYETDAQQGIGRGQSSVFKMMMRTEVENGIKPVAQVNLPIRSWPTGTVAYLYGVHFYQFVEQTYGKKAVQQLVENYSNNIIPFMINSNSEQVLDKDVSALWGEFSRWLKEKYKTDLEEAHIEGEQITQLGYNTGSPGLASDGQLYYVARGAFEHAALMQRIDNNNLQRVEVQSSGAQIDVHKDAGVLLVQLEFRYLYSATRGYTAEGGYRMWPF